VIRGKAARRPALRSHLAYQETTRPVEALEVGDGDLGYKSAAHCCTTNTERLCNTVRAHLDLLEAFAVATENVKQTGIQCREPLNGFAPNSHGRRVWFLARKSLNVKVKGQRSRSPGTKRPFSVLSSACVRFVS